MSQDIRNYFCSSDKKEKELQDQQEESIAIAFKLNQESAKFDPFFSDLTDQKKDIQNTSSNPLPLKFFEADEKEEEEEKKHIEQTPPIPQKEDTEDITAIEKISNEPEEVKKSPKKISPEEIKKKFSQKIPKKRSNYSFRKNMFSLKEDLQILEAIKFRDRKSARQVFRDLVVVMNRSDEALKTRYKAYLKKLSEIDKLMMFNKAKEIDSSTHCVIIHKDKKDGKKKIKEIVKNPNAGPPKEKVRPPKQPKSKRSSSKKRVPTKRKIEKIRKAVSHQDPLEMIKRKMEEIDKSNSVDENFAEVELDPFECKSEINDQEMTIEQGYDSEIILNSEDIDDQNTVSINETPKKSEIFFESENKEKNQSEKDKVDKFEGEFEIKPVKFVSKEKPIVKDINELLDSPHISPKKITQNEENEVMFNPFKKNAEEEIENVENQEDGNNPPAFFQEIQRPKLDEKPQSMLDRIIKKKEELEELEELEEVGNSQEKIKFNITSLEFDDIFRSEGSNIQKEAQKKNQVNSAKQAKNEKKSIFNKKFSSTGNERIRNTILASSPEFEKPKDYPEKELKQSKPNKNEDETKISKMRTVAARFRSMMKGKNQTDKEKSAELLYLFIKELSLYFDSDIHSVMKKIKRDQELNLEKLKMQLCHEYIGKRIIN